MDGPRQGSWMDDTGAGGQPSRAEFEALRRKVEAIDDFAPPRRLWRSGQRGPSAGVARVTSLYRRR